MLNYQRIYFFRKYFQIKLGMTPEVKIKPITLLIIYGLK